MQLTVGMGSSRSLAAQIQRANFWLTMLVVLCLGGSLLALSLSEVVNTQSKANKTAVNVIGQILTTEIKSQIDSIADLAASPITWTSLTDTTGREVYLKPTLAARANSLTANPTALFDYKGRYLAGSQPDGAEQARIGQLVADALTYKRRQMMVLDGSAVKLLVAEPVVYPYTQDVIGILTSEIGLSSLFRQRVAQEHSGVEIELRHAGKVVASSAWLNATAATATAAQHPGYLPAFFNFPLELNHEGRQTHHPEDLSVWLHSTQNPWWTMVLRLLGLALVIGTLLAAVVWRVSHNIGRRIAARIERLAGECEAISDGHAIQVTADAQGDEIGVLSRTLNHALEAYHHINQNLEAVVEQKTKALLESEGQFRGFFEHNASVMLQIDPHTGRVMLANHAAADFYGYSLDALMTMCIADINCAPPEKTQADMALVAHESRQSFIFQHRLRSGEVRDVEVYSTPMQVSQVPVLLSIVHDITDRLAAERKRKISDQALMSISQGVIVTDAQGKIVSMNNAFSDITGYGLEEVLGMQCKFLQGPDTDTDTIQAIRELQQAGRDFDGEILNYRKNGQIFWNAMSITRMFDDSGAVSHFIGIIRDITERKQAEERLRLAANVFTFASEGIMITSADGTIVDTNAAFSLITGYTQEEVVGQKPHLIGSGRQDSAFFTALWAELQSTGQWNGEIWNRRKTGEFYAAMLNVSAVRNSKNRIDYFVALYTDITAKKNYEHQLERRAHHDPLTGLANRVLFNDRLGQAIVQTLRHNKLLALVYLDLDGFKKVNDVHGHQTGDVLLIAVATRMQEVLREGDTLARIGGDEFVAVLVDLESAEESLPIMERMLLAASTPVMIEDVQVQVSASLGVTYFPQMGEATAEQLIEQADQAMYQAKQSGKNRIQVFEAAPEESVSAAEATTA